jgi:hypothetical protein
MKFLTQQNAPRNSHPPHPSRMVPRIRTSDWPPTLPFRWLWVS